MRKLALVITTLSVLAAASLVSPLGALASGSTHSPHPAGPRSGAWSSAVPTVRTQLPSAPSNSVTPVNCDNTFHTVSSPSGAGDNFLVSMAAIGANDVWAVGNSTSATADRALAEHWNGTSWSIVATPNPSAFSTDLNAVTAISTSDVWAVGTYQVDSGATQFSGFAEHWNGTSWSLVPMPQPSTASFIFGATAVSTSDVLAVGTWFNSGTSQLQTLVEQWNGATWSQTPSSNTTNVDNELFAISAFSASDMWATGETSTSIQGTAPLESLAEHWDGSNWSVISTPNLTGENVIIGVNALEAGHAVAVGFGNFVPSVSTREGEAWDLTTGGATNSVQAGPGAGDNVLLGVDRSGPAVWAVGYSRATAFSARQTLAIPATWKSTTHTLTWGSPGTSADPSSINNVLYGVAAISPYAFWAADYQSNPSNVAQTLIESYCALHFSLSAPVSTPSGSPFSITLTAETGSGATATGYLGKVHFTSSDALATLPPDYTFVPGDLGSHMFIGGVVLVTPCQETITAADMVMPLTAPGTATVGVFLGTCQAPGGTAGGRGVNQAPPGTPGPRGASQSGAGTPEPRLPRLGPTRLTTSAGAAASVATSGDGAPAAGGAGPMVARAAPRSATHALAAARSGTNIAPASAPPAHALSLVAQSRPVSPRPELTAWWLLFSLILFPLGAAWLRRRRFKEGSNV